MRDALSSLLEQVPHFDDCHAWLIVFSFEHREESRVPVISLGFTC